VYSRGSRSLSSSTNAYAPTPKPDSWVYTSLRVTRGDIFDSVPRLIEPDRES